MQLIPKLDQGWAAALTGRSPAFLPRSVVFKDVTAVFSLRALDIRRPGHSAEAVVGQTTTSSHAAAMRVLYVMPRLTDASPR